MPANAYKAVPLSVSSPDVSVNNMASSLQYSSLADYLTGRIAGLIIEGAPAITKPISTVWSHSWL